MAERLVSYKCPDSYEFVDEPVRDDAGKVRRSMLSAERS
jgi:bile acid-coenzyme A ligase